MTTILVNDILKQILDADPCAHTVCALLRVSKGVATQIRAIYMYNISAYDFALIGGQHYLQIVVRITDSFRKKGLKLNSVVLKGQASAGKFLTNQMKRFLVHRSIKTCAFEMFRDFGNMWKIKMKFIEFRNIICDPWVSGDTKLKFALYCQKNKDTLDCSTDSCKIFIDNSVLILSGHDAYLKKEKSDTYEIYVANKIESMYKYNSNGSTSVLNIIYGIPGENYNNYIGIVPKVRNEEYMDKSYYKTIENNIIDKYDAEKCIMRAVNYHSDESLKDLLESKQQQNGNFNNFTTTITSIKFLYSIGYNRSARVLMRPHLIAPDESKYENLLLLSTFVERYNLCALEDYYNILEMERCSKYHAMVKLLTHLDG